MILNKKHFSVFLFTFSTMIALGQQKRRDSTKVERLDEVVVTATRTLRQLSSLPMPVLLVSKVDILRSNSLRLSDILNEQTGLITVPDFGGGEGIQLQGLDSQYTLILIDGVPLIGRSAGTLDLSRITVGNIKQIEIVKGASSSLYGSEALGGVVNIITDTPKYGFRGETNLRSGSFGTNDLSVSASHKKDKFGINLFVNRFSSEGYDLTNSTVTNTVDPFSNYTFDTKVTYDFSEKLSLLFSGRYYTQNQDNVVQNTNTLEIYKGESDINEWNTRIKAVYKHNDKWQSLIELYGSQYKAEEFLNRVDGSLFSDSFFDQKMYKPEFRSTMVVEENELMVGLGTTYEALDRTYFSTTPIFNAPYLFAQYDMNPTKKLNIIVGARYDNHNQYQSQFNPKLAVNYKIDERISIKGSVGRGFKAPDFRQLYFDFTNSTVGYTVLGYNVASTRLQELANNGELPASTVANLPSILAQFTNELKAESSLGYNIGATIKPISNLDFSVNLFRNDVTNLIDTQVIAPKVSGQNVFSYVNRNKVFTQGLEFNSTYKPSDRLKLAVGYQLLYAKDKEAIQKFKEGGVNVGTTLQLTEDQYFGLFNRSKHMANIKVFYAIPKWNLDANIRATYRSKYGLFDTNGNEYLDTLDSFVEGYAIIDVAVNKTLFKNYQFSLGSDNLLGFTNTQVTNIPGRIIYGKLNIQF
ncbi:TonB-dependent receptor [Flavobacteriaceae bacterium S356]|uniref:TonB-dependent receptor n=1 Tax=Asprobacillus argus TaxID=3076534 RepID=A0ABU3LF31_9FLAO|nr:TonB-dependent receptor [Flavobacteriaceae bacterium S356]